MSADKDFSNDYSDISHLQTYHLSGSEEAMAALSSLERLLDALEMTAEELEEMCGEDIDL